MAREKSIQHRVTAGFWKGGENDGRGQAENLRPAAPGIAGTRGGSKLANLVYASDPSKETVTAVFQGGWKKVADVTADNGTALIYDVMRQIF